jgi:hypothetical protein
MGAPQAGLVSTTRRNFLTSLVEDYIKSHELDGICGGQSDRGLNNAIGSRHGGFNGRATLTCFCNHCRAVGRERGIDVERARAGLIELDKFARAGSADQKPSDGYFVTFWRILLNYPEILAWEKLWTDGQQEIYGEIYGTAKGINNQIQVGWHIWHNNSFSPFFRAEQDYTKLRQNLGLFEGGDLQQLWRASHGTVYEEHPLDDLSRCQTEETLAWHYRTRVMVMKPAMTNCP